MRGRLWHEAGLQRDGRLGLPGALPTFGHERRFTTRWLTRFGEVVSAYSGPAGSLYGDTLTPKDGLLRLPHSPGLGCDPDPEVLSAFAVHDAGIGDTGCRLLALSGEMPICFEVHKGLEVHIGQVLSDDRVADEADIAPIRGGAHLGP